MHLSGLGHDILIVDNLSRRAIDKELGAESLTPIAPLPERLRAWREVSGKDITFQCVDVAKEYDALLGAIRAYAPDAVVHFAEQRAAPYSMKSSAHKRYTVDNNTSATHNILAAIVESGLDIHLAHLGTMGVYGYSELGAQVPEGYLHVQYQEAHGPVTREILYPVAPGSIYHMTKCLDQLLFAYYAKNDKLRITDLHQGIVWGTQTGETRRDERLINRFDYDGDYGTVLNRFLMQAAIGHPLTVHGSGGQTRAFIHIQDTVRCVELALGNPPPTGERVRIYNQMTEARSVGELARFVSEFTGAEIRCQPTPRVEAENNSLRVDNRCFLDLGLQPTTLERGLLEEVMEIADKYKDRCDIRRIACTSYWNRERMLAAEQDRSLPSA